MDLGQSGLLRALERHAAERTRTSKGFPPHGPEPCASTRFRHSREDAEVSKSFAPRATVSPPLPPVRLAPTDHATLDGAPLSSRGLGRRPLTAETRVRIPVAVLQNP